MSQGGGDVDRTVTSSTELQATFETLAPGDAVYISAENAPYRTTDWLDIDVDGVSVFGPGAPSLVKPVANADVGGIRIGHNEPCENVLVQGVGFDGNPEEQGDDATRLHGIAVRNADRVVLVGNRIHKTHPFGHGDGGSGISVTRRCSDVRILGNEILDTGDRGIQVAGSKLVVAGNHVEGSLDRAVSCDLWYPDATNHTPQHVLVTGNLMGNVAEGSLTGVARNTPLNGDHGNISIVGNVGFGAHKSFCHVRGPEPVRNVTIQNNSSVQQTDGLETEQTEKYAGVAVDAATGRTLSVRNNSFYGYSGHGVHVNGEIRDVAVQHNTLAAPAKTGVRMRHAVGGTVTGNLVVDAGTAGLRLEDTADLVVRDNYVRRSGGPGIDARGSSGAAGHEIVANYVADVGRHEASDGEPPAIRVCDRGVRVRGNTVRRNRGEALVECDDAGENLYEANRADGDDPWRIESPDSRVRDNTPPLDIHHDLQADPAADIVEVAFDRPYARPPRLTFGRTGGPVQDITYRTDGDGNFVGAEISVATAGTFDIFVDDV